MQTGAPYFQLFVSVLGRLVHCTFNYLLLFQLHRCVILSVIPRATSYQELLQSKWNNAQFNKLRTIKETLGRTSFKTIATRREEIVLHRLRIGHTHLTHSYLLNSENAPECLQCLCLLTVEHILIQCPNYYTNRNRFFSSDSMKDLFMKIPYINIIRFPKEIQLFSKI